MFAILCLNCLGLFIELIVQYTMIVKSYEHLMLISFRCYQPLDIIWWFGMILVRAWAIVEAIVRSILWAIVRSIRGAIVGAESRRGAIVGAGSRGEELPFSAVSHSLLLLHEAPLADHGDIRAATLNWVSHHRMRKCEVGFQGTHQGSCPGTNCPSSIRWSPLPCRTCTRVSFEARIRSEVIFVEVQTILRCPSCNWCCTFLQVVSYQCFTVRMDMGRGHVEVQVELGWAQPGPQLNTVACPLSRILHIYC